MPQSSYSPHLFVTDDGEMYDTSRLRGIGGGIGLRGLGARQTEARRRTNAAGFESTLQQLSPGDQTKARYDRGVSNMRRSAPWDPMGAWFGVLQGRENAAQLQGKKFKMDWPRQRTTSMPRASLLGLSRAAGRAGTATAPEGDAADQAQTNHWMNQARLRQQNALASVFEDEALDSTFADDPYRSAQQAENAAASATTMGRAKFGLEQEQNLPRARMGIDAFRERLAASRVYPDIAEAEQKALERERQSASMKGLMDVIARAYGKDPEAADSMFEGPLGQTELFRDTFGNRAPRTVPGEDMSLDPMGMGAGDQPPGVSDLVDQGNAMPTDDLVERTAATLRERGLEPTEENIQRVLRNRMQRLGSPMTPQ